MELQIQYTVNMATGQELFKTGVLICGVGLIGRIVVFLTDRFRKNSYDHRSDEN